MDFPGGSDGKVSAYNAEDLGSTPGSGRPPGEGNGNPLQYSSLENAMAGGTWRAAVHGVTESDVPERLYFRFHSGVSVYPGLFFYAPPFPFGNHLFLYCSWQLLFGPFPIWVPPSQDAHRHLPPQTPLQLGWRCVIDSTWWNPWQDHSASTDLRSGALHGGRDAHFPGMVEAEFGNRGESGRIPLHVGSVGSSYGGSFLIYLILPRDLGCCPLLWNFTIEPVISLLPLTL